MTKLLFHKPQCFVTFHLIFLNLFHCAAASLARIAAKPSIVNLYASVFLRSSRVRTSSSSSFSSSSSSLSSDSFGIKKYSSGLNGRYSKPYQKVKSCCLFWIKTELLLRTIDGCKSLVICSKLSLEFNYPHTT